MQLYQIINGKEQPNDFNPNLIHNIRLTDDGTSSFEYEDEIIFVKESPSRIKYLSNQPQPNKQEPIPKDLSSYLRK